MIEVLAITKASLIWDFGILLSEGAAIWRKWVKVLYDWSFICFVSIYLSAQRIHRETKSDRKDAATICSVSLYPCLHGNLQTETNDLTQCYRPACH